MSYIWHSLIKTPISTSLTFFYHTFGENLGLAIIALTLLIQLLLTPLRLPSLRTSKKLQELKPHLDKLKEKHGQDQAGLVRAQMDLYQKHGVNPLGGILPTLASIPVIIALYQVLLGALKNGANLKTAFLWLNLAKPDPLFILPVLVGATQFFSTRLLMGSSRISAQKPDPASGGAEKREENEKIADSAAAVQSQMKFIFPLFSVFIVASLPSGVGLYWFVSLIFSIIQQRLVSR